MSMLRNRFLQTASFLSAPNDPPAGGKKPLAETIASVEDAGDDNDPGADDAAGDDPDADDADDADDAEDGADGADDDDPDLADLPPEVRAKAKAAIDKRVARETGWRDRQIDRLHAKRRAAEEDVQAAGAIVKRQAGAPTAASENLTQAQIEERARTLASQMSAQDRYDADADAAHEKGVATYGDKWGTALAKLPKLGGVDVTDMVDILATDQPHVVLMQLANPETYERVMRLSPARRRNEFVKLSLEKAPKPRGAVQLDIAKRPGDAPAPVTVIRGGRQAAAQQVDIYDDKADDDAWYRARNATRRKKFSNEA